MSPHRDDAPYSPVDPVAVEVLRGGRIESRHRAAAAVADAAGRVVLAVGEVGRPVYPRSAIKPLQALPLVETGAADRFGIGPAELALACASHGGEPRHVEAVRAWLARLGLDEGALRCGAHPPSHAASTERLIRDGAAPTPAHNNCSGKHTGMLATALHLGEDLAGYLAPSHPVQRRVAAVLADMAGAEPDEPGIDGCGLPNWPLPLRALATAMARLGDPAAGGLAPERARACGRIRAAMTAHPEMVAGEGRACTAIMAAAPHLLVKTGAEGVYMAAWPARGLGLALKVEDGAGRASPVALLALFERLGALDDGGDARDALAPVARPVLRNHAGTVVGGLRPVPGWPPADAPGGHARLG
ncbi:MAG TPA: asparaginase [Geminicoccaceae bacterium]|nr:asparaginase [Geminicoccaceae bacterium]